MSLLSDPELNYIRQVLPSHSPISQKPGTGPHNLINFNTTTLSSPYIQLAGLANERKWPELSSGRDSPPLGLGSNRRERRGNNSASGPSGTTLNYSKTIGRRLGGEEEASLGRRRGNSLTIETSSAAIDKLPVMRRRRSLEQDLHQKRINTVNPSLVVHSPIKTPLTATDVFDASDVSIATVLPPISSEISGESDEEGHAPDSLAQSVDSDYIISPRPLSLIDETREVATSFKSSPPLSPNGASSSITNSISNESISSLTRPSSLLSTFSSTISDEESHHGRSDSEASLTSPLPLVAVIEEGPLVRPRRRVNISGRLAVAGVGEPSKLRDGAPTARTIPEGDLLEVPLRQLSTRTRTKSTSTATPPQATTPPTTTTALASSSSTSAAAVLPTGSNPPTPRSSRPSISFARSSRPPPPARSALTNLMTALNEPTAAANPYSTFYGALSSKGSDALSLSLYFPDSKEPKKKLKVAVMKDSTVEEVIGVGLWAYYDQGREPVMERDEGEGERETTKWNLRIVEDDGEVDEDFPALDRSRAIAAFSFGGEFAVVGATASQIKDNLIKQSKIRRRPSRILASTSKRNGPTLPGSTTTNPAGSSTPAAIVVLRILLPQIAGLDGITTTLNVADAMDFNDVVDGICAKRGIDNPREWVLMAVRMEGNEPVVLAPNSTVATLGDILDLSLVRRRDIGGAENFNQFSDPQATITYRRYSVYRKLPMPLGRHARTIALDLDYIHLLPAENRGMFDVGKTISYHVSAIVECRVSKRSKNNFKVLVQKDRRVKRYDFEGESVKQTADIVLQVSTMIKLYKDGRKSGSYR